MLTLNQVYDLIIAMKVNIGVLKNDLSKYLHKVRDGEEITITDRNQPVAKIVPLERPLVKMNLSEWIKNNPPMRTGKKQPSSIEMLRELRDVES